ncbi:MAG: sensor domain-containing diguanylate cyclase [Giesbergeria sp.]
MQELLHTLPGAVLLSQNDVIVYANAASAALFEVASPELLHGHTTNEFVHPLDKQRSSERIFHVSSRGNGLAATPNKPSEFRIRTSLGNLRMVLVSSVALVIEGKPAVLMCGMDMTHMSEIQQQLRESEHNFRRLFESMQDVYYRTNAQGVVQHVGPGVRRVLGYEPHEIEGHTAESYYPQSKDRDAFKAAIMAHGEVADFSGQMVRKDGTIIDISISSHLLFDHNGQFSGIEGIYRDVTQRKNLERELQRLATTDMLTGMANRRAFLEIAEKTYTSARQNSEPMSLLMLDLDHFKNVNDRNGHLEGDRVLAAFAQTVQAQLRASDSVGRLGGEEFCVLLPQTDVGNASEIAERVLVGVRAMPLTTAAGEAFKVTVSIGLAGLCPEDRSLHDLLNRADQSLYSAKRSGRDRISTAAADDEPKISA